MKNEQERRDLFALAAWLQTFPEFASSIYNGSEEDEDVERLLALLDSAEVTLDVSKVAEIICGASVDSTLAKSPLDTEAAVQDRDTSSGSDLIWRSLRTMGSTMARPISPENQYSNEKVLVLSSLLDCAVHVPDKHQRRTYIGRIMTLKKSTQKTIMAMIESRSSNTSNHSPVKGATSSQIKSSQQESSTNSTKSPPLPTSNRPALISQQNLTPPVRLFTAQFPSSTKRNAETVISRMSCGGASSVNTVVESSMRTPPSRNHSNSTPLKSSLKKSGDTSSANRGYSVAFGSPVAKSLDGSFRRQSFEVGAAPFLSPGTLESPSRMQSILVSLQRQNEAQQQKLESFQNQEVEMKKHMEQMEATFRQKMITMENQSLQRVQDIARESEQQIAALQAQLAQAQELSSEGSVAMRELKAVKDELEVMNHSKLALTETTEKLRKYKDKITELQDVKEALRKEQEAHGQSVDEVIRLESELQQLQSVKRQVEDYRVRAVEAEVKLVECQDYLRRMERQCKDQTSKNDHLYQNVIMQKEHMEELQRRIQEDTQRVSETTISGIGEGINELNPELKEELLRLRNENLQLRAFQAKRTEDAVQYLEESLDDSKRLAERYKDEFLRTKDDLAATHSALQESREHEASLHLEVTELRKQCCELEQQCLSFQEKLEFSGKELHATMKTLEESENHNASLLAEVNEWKRQQQEASGVAEERLQQIQQLMHELNVSEKALRHTQENVKKLNLDAENMQTTAIQNAEHLQFLQTCLDKTTWDLEESRNKFAHKQDEAQTLQNQNSTFQKQINGLEEKLRIERNQRKEEAREAQLSLETTRQLLETKSKKELEELQANMARLLDDERKAYRKKDEDAKRHVAELESQWQEKYLELQNRSTSALQNSRQQAQEQVDFIKQENMKDVENLKQEWANDVVKIKKESEETLDNFIRKGKEKVKVMQAKVHEELQRLDDERRDIEEKYYHLERQSSENEVLLEGQIFSLKQQLEFTTNQMNDRIREADEHLDLIKTLEREKFKLNEENEQYRRQLGGRHGADSQIQSQLEKLQKEYSAVVEENRNLKTQLRNGNGIGSILDTVDDGRNRSYRHGSGVDRRALTQLQKDFEERIDVLNNEKRDLIMKMSSQSTDVHRAEKRAFECEEEISRLKAENTSLKLRLERNEFSSEDHYVVGPVNENRSPTESSSQNAHPSTSSPSKTNPDISRRPIVQSSPGIDRAKKHKMEQENILRNRFSSITGTPPRSEQQNVTKATESVAVSALSTSQNLRIHPSFDAGANIPEIPIRSQAPVDMSKSSPRTPSKISKMASDVFRLGLIPGSPRSNAISTNNTASSTLQPETTSTSTTASTQPYPYVQFNEQLNDNHNECKQI